MRKLAKQTLRITSKKINEKYIKRHNLTWFGHSTYVHKEDEKSTINMRVQIPRETTSTNSLGIHGRFTQVTTYQACDPSILPLTKTLKALKTKL